ncbi:MAG TPA: hypothetical protein DCW83_05735 [Saprospirales bacterium]|jgi:hypothetical protein|nr:hypothetical protein [Saprospirales bacterium]
MVFKMRLEIKRNLYIGDVCIDVDELWEWLKMLRGSKELMNDDMLDLVEEAFNELECYAVQ